MKNTLLLSLLSLPRRMKQFVLMVADFCAVPFLLWGALALRYDSLYPPVLPGLPYGLLLVALFSVLAFKLAGVYRAVVRAFDEKFLQVLLLAVGFIVISLFTSAAMQWISLPRSTPFTFGFFAFIWIWASRSLIRKIVRMMVPLQAPVIRVAIYGAGGAGRQLIAALRAAPEYFPVAFFDDNRSMIGTNVQGLRVYAGKDFERVHK